MSQWSYITVKELRLQAGATKRDEASERDNIMLAIGVAVSQQIDNAMARSFRVYTGARTFTPEWSDKLSLPDLLGLTTLRSDDDFDGVYETTWVTGTDYLLGPLNAPLDQRPYTHVRVGRRPGLARGFFVGWDSHIEIDGKWGFWDARHDTGSALTDNITSTQDEIGVTATDMLSAGMTLYIGDEQVFVRSLDTVNSTMTVDRAQNNTLTAAHLAGVGLIQQDYPAAVRQAALLWANRIYSREKTPLGIINMPGDVGWRAVYIPQFDVDVRQLLQGYRRGGGLV
jgi:hypothetical protein